MKVLLVAALLPLAVFAQVPDFGGSDVEFITETEPDKDGPVTDPKPTTTPPTEGTKPPTTPPRAVGAGPVLPGAENCTGVQCDLETIRDCARPVLFAKHCCPVCPDLSPCEGVVCNASRNEVCSVHGGQAICCTDLGQGHGHHDHHDDHHDHDEDHDDDDDEHDGHGRHGGRRGGYRHRRSAGRHARRHDHRHADVNSHLIKLRCRYQLGNCSLRYEKNSSRVSGCGSNCTSNERCQAGYRLVSRGWRIYRVRSQKCCAVNRPECPMVEPPTVLGHCRVPGGVVQDHAVNCTCSNITMRRRPYFYYRRGKRSFDSFLHRGVHFLHRLFLPWSSEVCTNGERSITVSSMVGDVRQRCRCSCEQVDSFGEQDYHRHHRINRSCHKMAGVSRTCRRV